MKLIINKISYISNMQRFFCMAIATIFVALNLSAADAPAKKQKSGRNNDTFTVVIDAGHGGHDHGAVDNGAREKDINLGVAKKLAANIKKKLKNVKVVMTRDDDTFISLQERANIANRNRGNLFISIHTNSVDKKSANRKTVSGTSVYSLGPQKDANNLKVAQRENSVIELEDNYHHKYSGFDPSKDESYIIFEMAQKKTLGQSLKFADNAQKELVATAGRKDRGVKQAGFWVLWATSMPSVLVELDFICNPTEAAFLNSEKGQQKLADALTNALEKYIDSLKSPVKLSSSSKSHKSQESFDKKEDDMEAADRGTTSLTTRAETSTNADYDGVNTLVSSNELAKNKRTTTKVAAVPKSGSTARKRRSKTSKQNSDKRQFETNSIKLKYEEELLARQEITEEKPQQTVTEQPAEEKNKKNKDKKKKKEKKQKKSSKKVSKSSGVSTASSADNSAGKSIVSADAAKTSEVKENKGKKTFVVRKSTAPEGKMVYKIQIAASSRKLANDDEIFCGIKPTGMFVENDLYKYTVGESSDRREIERQLLNIKTVIPDAFIIVRLK